MQFTKSLVVWTIIFHFFIVVGMGHGVTFLGMLEILGFPYFPSDPEPGYPKTAFDQRLPIALLLIPLGQAALIGSLLIKNNALHKTVGLIGLLYLWLTVLNFYYRIEPGEAVGIVTFTTIPFAVTSFLILLNKPLVRLYQRVTA